MREGAFGLPLVFRETMATFTPPTSIMHYQGDPLMSRIGYATGISLLKTNGFYALTSFPSDEEIAAAEIAYLGGHEYEITEDEVTSLTNAGYGDLIS